MTCKYATNLSDGTLTCFAEEEFQKVSHVFHNWIENGRNAWFVETNTYRPTNTFKCRCAARTFVTLTVTGFGIVRNNGESILIECPRVGLPPGVYEV